MKKRKIQPLSGGERVAVTMQHQPLSLSCRCVEKFNCICLHINISWCKVVKNKESWTYQTVFNNIIAGDMTTVDAMLMLHDDSNPFLAGEWLNFFFFIGYNDVNDIIDM